MHSLGDGNGRDIQEKQNVISESSTLSHVTESFFTLPGTMLPMVHSQTQELGREMGEADCRAGPEPPEGRAQATSSGRTPGEPSVSINTTLMPGHKEAVRGKCRSRHSQVRLRKPFLSLYVLSPGQGTLG